MTGGSFRMLFNRLVFLAVVFSLGFSLFVFVDDVNALTVSPPCWVVSGNVPSTYLYGASFGNNVAIYRANVDSNFYSKWSDVYNITSLGSVVFYTINGNDFKNTILKVEVLAFVTTEGYVVISQVTFYGVSGFHTFHRDNDLIDFSVSYSFSIPSNFPRSGSYSGVLFLKGHVGPVVSGAWRFMDELIVYSVEGQLYSYDCQTNKAVFSLASSFQLQSIHDLSIENDFNNETIAGYSFDVSSWHLTVNFTQKINDYAIKTLKFLADGVDPNSGVSVSNVEGSISFTGCASQPPISPKDFNIVQPSNGSSIPPDTASLFVSSAYGGVVSSDFPSGSVFEVSFVLMRGFETYATYTTVDFQSGNNITYWSGSLAISGFPQGSYTLNASLTIRDANGNIIHTDTDSITIAIGTPSSGNPLIDFLIWLWNEVKKWFVEVMRFLFVPNSSDISKLLQNGWIHVENPIMTTQPITSIKLPAFWSDTGYISVDFGQIRDWSGYSVFLSISRLALWVLLVYLVWSVLL